MIVIVANKRVFACLRYSREFPAGFSNWCPPEFHNSDEIAIILPYLGILARDISGKFPAIFGHLVLTIC